ncbi:MAG: universal stress protein [Alphaproteobacteria bacterium]|nr:universal stress protein [Alphaproteobacteria bacterium]
MKRILVATDFSTRSDRAIRRATLLARTHGSSMTVVHVIDDDQPKRILKAERDAASVLLSEQARSLREIDGVDCDYSVVLGNAFEGIAKAAEETNCDLLVIGPHRRQALKDVFVGTTAERTIRASSRPILMANGVPAASYRHVLVAVDFSDCSADAVQAVRALCLDRNIAVSVAHVFDTPASGMMVRASSTEDQIKDYIADEQERASAELTSFLGALKFTPMQQVLRPAEGSAASTIATIARAVSSDLIVVGTHGRTGITKALLGSVAEEMLRVSDRDVLAVPPRRHGDANATAS